MLKVENWLNVENFIDELNLANAGLIEMQDLDDEGLDA
jgi:hypothetical protein